MEYTVCLDAFYATTWSIGHEIAIVGRTLWINLVGKTRGAMLPPC